MQDSKLRAVAAYGPTKVSVGVCRAIGVPHPPVIAVYRHIDSKQVQLKFLNMELA